MENKEAVSIEGVVLEPTKDIAVFDKFEAERQKLREQVLAMKVQDEKDTHGRQMIKDFKNRTLVKLRNAVVQAHKDKKAPYLNGGRIIDAAKKSLVEKIEAMEAHLDKQIAIVDSYEREQLRIKREAQEARINSMVDKLKAIDVVPPMTFLEKCSDSEFNEYYTKEKEKYETLALAREEKLKAEKEERERLEAQRKELEAKEAELKAKQDAIEKAEREAREKELAKQKAETEALKAKEEARLKEEKLRQEEAKKASDDEALYEELLLKFDNLPDAILEIIRLGKLVKKLKGEK